MAVPAATTASENGQGLTNVARGLVLVFFSINLQLLGATLALLAAFLVVGGFDLPLGPIALAIHLVFILTTTLFQFGLLYCLGAPVRPGPLAAIGGSALMAGVAVCAEISTIWPEVRAALGVPLLGMPSEHPVLTLRTTVSISPLFLMAAHFLFVLFLRSLAQCLGEPRLATRALSILVIQVVLTAAGAGTLMLLTMEGDSLRKLPLVAFLWLGGLAMWGLYCYLLLNLRQVLRNKGDRHVLY